MTDRGPLASSSPDAVLRSELLAQLPKTFFAPSPARLGYLAAATIAMLTSLWAAHEWLAGRYHLSVYVVAVVVAAFVYPWFLFSLHELGHGAIVRNRAARLVLGWLAGFWIGFQPRFWNASHGHHHHHANTEQDTDRLRFYDRDEPGARFLDFRLSNPASIPSAMLAIQIVYAFCMIGFLRGDLPYPLKRWQVVGETMLHAAAAGCLVYAVGTNVWLFGYLPVFVLGCMLQNTYVITNHLTRPLTDSADALGTAQSVHIRGWSHMDFGRHVEHHLFPTVSHRKLRRVSEALRAGHPDRFVERSLFTAIATLFRLPGYYYSYNELTDRRGRTRVPIN
jgi:fatty acid desaturase